MKHLMPHRHARISAQLISVSALPIVRRYPPTRSLAPGHHFGQHRHYHRSRIRHRSGRLDRLGSYTTAPAPTSFSVEPALPLLGFAATPGSSTHCRSNSTGAIRKHRPVWSLGQSRHYYRDEIVSLIADQAASGNYPAGIATISVSVAAATPTLSFAAIANQTCTPPRSRLPRIRRRHNLLVDQWTGYHLWQRG